MQEGLLIALFSLFAVSGVLFAQVPQRDFISPVPDIIAPDSASETPLTPDEVLAEKTKFREFIRRYKASEFVGQAQYLLSSLNLSLKAHVIYDLEDNGTILFHVATAGNHQVAAGDVTFPLQARVFFELRNQDGTYQQVKMDGVERELRPRRGVFYLVETVQGFKERSEVQSKVLRGPLIGQFLAEVEFDLFTQRIRFYEISESSSIAVLVRKGTFSGNVGPSRRGY